MVRYAQDVRTCRHQMFDVHFSKHLSKRLPPCGFCDNCVLAGSDVTTEDIKSEVRALCALIDRLKSVNERVTLNKLVEAWRGVGSLRAIAKIVRDECETTVAAKLKIDFGRDRSRTADDDETGVGSSAPAAKPKPKRTPEKSRVTNNGMDENDTAAVHISESEIQHILDEENWSEAGRENDDDDDMPLMSRSRFKRKRTKLVSEQSANPRDENSGGWSSSSAVVTVASDDDDFM
ncbi:hypothetical protein BGX28_008611 [Mortierella sp. GBA30]|nr:hypothetical protein BGX28_008611 [Mortierella sp. GBA30]